MEVKNLDTDFLVYSNDEVFTALRHLTSVPDDEYLNSISRLLFTSKLINHITNIELLFNTVRLLKTANLLSEYDDVFEELQSSVFKDLQYSETDIVRILSFVVSGLLDYEIYSKILRELGITDVESFKYGIEQREVQILNLNPLKNKVKKNNAKAIIIKSERLDPKARERYLYNIVSSLQLIKYENETSYFDNEIELYKSQLGLFQLLDFPVAKGINKEFNKNDDRKFKTLKDIFKNNDDFELCIDELRKTNPPIINSKRKYLLGDRKKKSIVAWIDILNKKDFISKPNDKLLAPLLTEYFENFSISDKTLRNEPTDLYEDYEKHFQIALPNPKK